MRLIFGIVILVIAAIAQAFADCITQSKTNHSDELAG